MTRALRYATHRFITITTVTIIIYCSVRAEGDPFEVWQLARRKRVRRENHRVEVEFGQGRWQRLEAAGGDGWERILPDRILAAACTHRAVVDVQ